MNTTQRILEARREIALEYADKVEWDINSVPSDDYGDTQWRYHIEYYIVINGIRYELGDDYFRVKPNATEAYNTMLSCLKDGMMGDVLADIITQAEHRGEC